VLRISLERELVALPLTPAAVEIPVQPEADRAH